MDAIEADLLHAKIYHGHAAAEAGEFDRAAEIYKQCLAAAEARQDEQNAVWAIHFLMYADIYREKYEDALRWAEQGIQRAPDQAFSYGMKGYLHMAAGQWEPAAAEFERSVEMEPTAIWPLFLWVSKVRQGQLKEATERLRNDLSKVELTDKSHQQVAAWILNGMEGDPTLHRPQNAAPLDDFWYSESCFVAGHGLLASGRTEEAVTFFNESIRCASPTNLNAVCAAAELQRVGAVAK